MLYQIIKVIFKHTGLLFLLFTCPGFSQENKQSNSIITQSPFEIIDTADHNRFTFLKEILKNKRIVLLGEKTHNDGSTLNLKVELIKYLHDTLGYNILLVENGIYDTHRAWKDIIEKKDSAVGVFAYLFHLFGNIITDYNLKLAKYIDQKKDSDYPLILNGIDITFSTVYAQAFYLELEQLLKKIITNGDSSSLNDFNKFSLKGKLKTFSSSEESLRWQKEQNLDTINFYANRLINFLKQKQIEFDGDSMLSQRDIPLFIQSIYSMLANYPYTIETTEKLLKGSYGKGKDRDEFIAKNAIWYIDQYYPDQKFIISMSTFHTTKNFEPLREKYNALKEIKPLGEYLFEKYGQETYSICFVNYSGKRRDLHDYNITQTPIAPKVSIEKTMHDAKARLAFVNISDTVLFPYEFRNKSLSPIYDEWYSTEIKCYLFS